MNSNDQFEVIKNCVNSFRVVELKSCLKLLQKPVKPYRKAELKKIIFKHLDGLQRAKADIPALFANKIFQLERSVKNSRQASKIQMTESDSILPSPFFETVEVLKTCTLDRNVKSATMDLNIPYRFRRRLYNFRIIKGFRYEVQILFGDFKDDWNPKTTLRLLVNGISFQASDETQQIIYITSHCSFNNGAKNIIQVDFPFIESELKVTASIVKRFTPSQILKEKPVKQYPRISQLLNKQFMEKNMAVYEIRLICPFEKKIIRDPCRSTLCHHPEMFDLTSFLNIQQYVLKLKCPICQKGITWDSLEMDTFFKNYLDEDKVNFTFYKPRIIPSGFSITQDYIDLVAE